MTSQDRALENLSSRVGALFESEGDQDQAPLRTMLCTILLHHNHQLYRSRLGACPHHTSLSSTGLPFINALSLWQGTYSLFTMAFLPWPRGPGTSMPLAWQRGSWGSEKCPRGNQRNCRGDCKAAKQSAEARSARQNSQRGRWAGTKQPPPRNPRESLLRRGPPKVQRKGFPCGSSSVSMFPEICPPGLPVSPVSPR